MASGRTNGRVRQTRGMEFNQHLLTPESIPTHPSRQFSHNNLASISPDSSRQRTWRQFMYNKYVQAQHNDHNGRRGDVSVMQQMSQATREYVKTFFYNVEKLFFLHGAISGNGIDNFWG